MTSPHNLPIIPVIMCTWQRPERLAITLADLAMQTNCQPQLHIWNNNPEIADMVDERSRTANLPVTVTHSPTNIRGFGRFYKARELANQSPFVVMIDDDVELGSNALHSLYDEHVPKTLRSFFAFNLHNPSDYFDRDPAVAGEHADYCGTGGMIIDSEIFLSDKLFECPEAYRDIEDLWLCAVAQRLGWQSFKSGADITLSEGDYKDQWLLLESKKSQFLEHLVSEGFQISG